MREVLLFAGCGGTIARFLVGAVGASVEQECASVRELWGHLLIRVPIQSVSHRL